MAITSPSSALKPVVVSMLTATLQRAQAGAGPKMGDNDATCRQHRRLMGQAAGDIFVGQPVKTVTPNARVGNRPRQRQSRCHWWHCMMKRRIEAGDLR